MSNHHHDRAWLLERRRLLALIYLLSVISGLERLSAQTTPEPDQVRFRNLSIADGLSDPTVNCIHQDRRGFMWFGTQDGLNRYDGRRFEVFRPEPEGEHETDDAFSVEAICEDVQGFLWMGGTNSGLHRFDPVKGGFVGRYAVEPKKAGRLFPTRILSLAPTGDGRLWIGTDFEGLLRFDPETEVLEHFPLREPEPNNWNEGVIYTLLPDPSDAQSVWLGTAWLGLVHLDAATGSIRRFNQDPPDAHAVEVPNRVIHVHGVEARFLWVGGGDGLYRFDLEERRFVDRFDFDADFGGVQSVLVDQKERLWLAFVGAGLGRFSPETQVLSQYRHDPADRDSLRHDHVTRLYQDRTGVIWVALRYRGLCVFDPNGHWLGHRDLSGFNGGTQAPLILSEVVQDRVDPNLVWIGGNRGLLRWDRRRNEMTSFRHDPEDPTSLSGDSIFSLCARKHGGVWMGAGKGLNHFDPALEAVVRFAPRTESAMSLTNVRIRTLSEDSSGGLWAGRNVGYARLDLSSGDVELFRYKANKRETIPPGRVDLIHQDKEGWLWIVMSSRELCRLDPYGEGFIRMAGGGEGEDALLGNVRVHSVYENREQGLVWLGTSDGLTRVRLGATPEGQMEISSFSTGLHPPDVNLVTKGGDDELWLITQKGVVQASAVSGPSPQFRWFGEVAERFDAPVVSSVATLDSGELICGTDAGLLEIDPRELVLRDAPPVVISKMHLRCKRRVKTGTVKRAD